MLSDRPPAPVEPFAPTDRPAAWYQTSAARPDALCCKARSCCPPKDLDPGSDFAEGLLVDQRCQAFAASGGLELVEDRPRDRDLLRGQTARVSDDFRIAQQVECALEHRTFHLRPILKERAQLGAALDAEHDR